MLIFRPPLAVRTLRCQMSDRLWLSDLFVFCFLGDSLDFLLAWSGFFECFFGTGLFSFLTTLFFRPPSAVRGQNAPLELSERLRLSETQSRILLFEAWDEAGGPFAGLPRPKQSQVDQTGVATVA